ncbi:MAG: hypothetical protein JO327_11165 [Nitrososphaeraceae archaeon]|nr:hypothetical protein [Nitrososphaeraceae archaeon]MBV9668674.1 hypothetical protein [Nitrososphaeraceae archaeon]
MVTWSDITSMHTFDGGLGLVKIENHLGNMFAKTEINQQRQLHLLLFSHNRCIKFDEKDYS